jgi:hypothetical protein
MWFTTPSPRSTSLVQLLAEMKGATCVPKLTRNNRAPGGRLKAEEELD